VTEGKIQLYNEISWTAQGKVNRKRKGKAPFPVMISTKHGENKEQEEGGKIKIGNN